MKIEAGKYYKLECGLKAFIYSTDNGGGCPVHGCVIDRTDNRAERFVYSWRIDGKHAGIYSIVSEWIDRPEMDWSALPKWAKWIAKDSQGYWFWFVEKPAPIYDYSADLSHPYRFGYIPDDLAPKWSGEWEQSVTEVKR